MSKTNSKSSKKEVKEEIDIQNFNFEEFVKEEVSLFDVPKAILEKISSPINAETDKNVKDVLLKNISMSCFKLQQNNYYILGINIYEKNINLNFFQTCKANGKLTINKLSKNFVISNVNGISSNLSIYIKLLMDMTEYLPKLHLNDKTGFGKLFKKKEYKQAVNDLCSSKKEKGKIFFKGLGNLEYPELNIKNITFNIQYYSNNKKYDYTIVRDTKYQKLPKMITDDNYEEFNNHIINFNNNATKKMIYLLPQQLSATLENLQNYLNVKVQKKSKDLVLDNKPYAGIDIPNTYLLPFKLFFKATIVYIFKEQSKNSTGIFDVLDSDDESVSCFTPTMMPKEKIDDFIKFLKKEKFNVNIEETYLKPNNFKNTMLKEIDSNLIENKKESQDNIDSQLKKELEIDNINNQNESEDSNASDVSDEDTE